MTGARTIGNVPGSEMGFDFPRDQARKRRTFEYQGKGVVMTRHLKIGRKDSVAETLRIQFYWDANARKVVIGHCGPHLDFD